MPVTLANVTAGTPISATVLRDRLQTVETYLNEQILNSDRADEWMQANHVYRPDFFGGSNPHTTLTTGESYFRSRPIAEERRAFFSYYLGQGPYPIPGLNATVQIPEDLTGLNYDYRLVVTASFYCYEYGGADGNMDESTYEASQFTLLINGVPARSDCLERSLYKGSQTATEQASAFYPRKQISMVWGDVSAPTVDVGVNSIGVAVMPGTPLSTEWKHIIVQQGNLIARYFLR
jgi:hypothetical protein